MEVTWDCTESKVGAQLLLRTKRTEALTSIHAKEILNDIFNLQVSFTQSWVGFFFMQSVFKLTSANGRLLGWERGSILLESASSKRLR